MLRVQKSFVVSDVLHVLSTYPDVPAERSKLLSFQDNGVEEAQTKHHSPPIKSKSWQNHTDAEPLAVTSLEISLQNKQGITPAVLQWRSIKRQVEKVKVKVK